MSVDFDVKRQQGIDFFSGGSFIMDSILARSDRLKLKFLFMICFL